LAVPSVPEKISSSKIWPSVSGCWLYTPNDLAIDSCVAQGVLGCVAQALGRMEKTSHFGYAENGCWLASGWLSAVLEMALQD
jgi:hypothetical protein